MLPIYLNKSLSNKKTKNILKEVDAMRNCSFGGDRVAVLLKDGRICVKDRQSKGNTDILQACGAICLTLNGLVSFLKPF